jgi:YHS domain-containing protein
MFLIKCLRVLTLSLTLAVAGIGAAAVVSTAAHADTKPAIFAERGIAVGGYDLTSYFTGAGTPVKGVPQFAATHQGATYHFANAANRDAFRASPARYLPQYGGYCAWAVSQGYTAPGRPQHYKVVNGKLYLNFNGSIQNKWARDIPGHISSANNNWPKALTK